ncbi:MAG TPA: outer membrane beta-barrel protein [Stellaceae bacterium]|nr:outer membrane beta-barrel protein [Stellaceae bacterium]
MNKMKKSTISGAAFVWAVLGLGSACAWADQLAQLPSAPSPPAPPPPPGAPTAGAPPGAAAAPAPAPAAPTSPLIAPSITGPLTIQLPPTKYTLGPLGDIYLNGIGSGLFQWQNNVVRGVLPGNNASIGDLNNGQFFVQKTDGLVQFYAQAGAYSITSLGLPYISTALATWGANSPAGNLWGWFPQGFVKIVPTDNFSVQAGKLPTLIGAEYTFDFENINIERGLLWNQEPAVSKGAQANYTWGPLAFSLSFTDGFDSGVYNWLTASATYTLNPANSFEFAAGGNVGTTRNNNLRTPILQSNSEIYNLIYTYNSDPWIIQPYFQATHVPTNIGLYGPSASSFGGAVLVNYDVGAGFNLGGRVEYIGTTGNNNLLYGPGSGAFSLTFTPTYQYKYFFTRGEVSWVKANSIVSGLGFGSGGTNTSQTRVLVETGILF